MKRSFATIRAQIKLLHCYLKAVQKSTQGKDAQAVIATHTNTDHVHCHILVNSYSISIADHFPISRLLKPDEDIEEDDYDEDYDDEEDEDRKA